MLLKSERENNVIDFWKREDKRVEVIFSFMDDDNINLRVYFFVEDSIVGRSGKSIFENHTFLVLKLEKYGFEHHSFRMNFFPSPFVTQFSFRFVDFCDEETIW